MRDFLVGMQIWIDEKLGVTGQVIEKTLLAAVWTALGALFGEPVLFGLGALHIIMFDELRHHIQIGTSVWPMLRTRLLRTGIPAVIVVAGLIFLF